MNSLLKFSLLGLMALSGIISSEAQKRGTFNKNIIRPERVEAVERTKPSRPIMIDPVLPKGFSQGAKIVDVSNGALSAKGLSTKTSVPAKILGDGTTIYGSLIYANSWVGSNARYGVYSFPASSYTAPELVYAQGGLEANGGGCYHDGKYYWNSFVYTDEMGYTFTTFCTYDFRTKEFNKNILSFINDSFDLQQITNALTYDASTDRIFALANIKVVDETGFIERYYPALSEIDPYTGFATPIARIPAMVALASTPGGELYAISKGDDAALYRINKSSGDLTLIGSTGLSTNFAQSMTFDPITGKLYWAAVRSNGATGLYEVDVTTGHASEIFAFGDNEEFTGLYIPEPEINANAPAAVSALTPQFTNGALTGSISVTAPSKAYNGASLSGDLTLTVITDMGAAETQTVTAGQTVTLPRTLTEGIHSFCAYASNASGDGPRVSASCYVGIDGPAAVRNLSLTKTADGKAHLSWQAPLTGRNDGYIDPAQLSYTITRMPDETVVAEHITSTELTDPVDAAANNYYYRVVPYCGNREGIVAETESGIFGYGTSLPCIFNFGSKEEYDLFTVIDANNDWDGEYKWGGWMYSGDFKYTTDEDGNCAVYGYHPETAADDWLITPPVGVEQGKKYRVTFTMWTRGQEEQIEVTAGPLNTIAAQSVILPKAGYTHKDHRQFTADFTASATGNYHVGFHITSKKKQYYAFVSDIKVDVVPDEDAPEAVQSLTVTPAPNGDSKAVVSFTAPTKSLAGTTLSTLDKVEIYHGIQSAPVATLSATPGENISWTDRGVAGFVDYRVIAYANGKAGAKAEARAYVGWDIPMPVTGITVDDAGGHPVISWTAPTQGVNGGYIDANALTYTIFRYEDDFTQLGNKISDTSFTDTQLDSDIQHLVAYVVYAQSEAGYSDPEASDYIVYGDPYKGEFLEDFSDASVHSTPWVMYRLRGNTQNWGITSYGTNPTCYPAGNDGGMAVYGTDGRVGDEGLLVSPKLDISSIGSPVLTFYLYHNYTDEHAAWDEAFEDRLIPEVMLPDGTREALHDPIYVDDLGVGWLKYTCDLTDYKQDPWIRIAMHGITACEQDIYVDHIAVTNQIYNDLQVYAFTGSSKVEAGKAGTYKLTIYNRGANEVAAGAYTVSLYEGGQKLETLPGVAINSKEYRSFTFERNYDVKAEGSSHTLYAVIEWNEDELPQNNTSTDVLTTVTPAVLPEVSTLEAAAVNKNVTLDWGTPDSHHVVDSFEDHTPFESQNFGSYTMHDGDGNYTWSFSDIYFDNAGDAQAFMVFNPVALGIVDPASSLFPYDAFDPHSGNQVLACFQGVTADSQGYAVSATNDDWFISPKVYGGQTIAFYAKSGDFLQGVDKFEVMYSTSTNNVTAFRPLSDVVSTTAEWTRHEFTLPAGCRYFAIHCVSDDGFVLFIDDLEFVEMRDAANLDHNGYRLYRDGKLLGEFAASTNSYSDNALADGEYTYHVTATYGNGRESAPGNYVTVRVGDVGIQDATVNTSIRTANGQIIIESTEAVNATVVSLEGRILYKGSGNTHSINVMPGIYVVTVNGRSQLIRTDTTR